MDQEERHEEGIKVGSLELVIGFMTLDKLIMSLTLSLFYCNIG